MRMVKTMNYEKRLAEIALIPFGELSDEAVLHLLAERKQLQELQTEYQELQHKQEERARLEAERTAVKKELTRLNKLISPDKPDEELIHLIEERKTWEAKMEAAEKNISALEKGGGLPAEEAAPTEVPAAVSVPEAVPSEQTVVEEPVAQAAPSDEARDAETMASAAVDRDFGKEKVVENVLDESSEFIHYLEEIKRSAGSIGRILENLPPQAKKDKVFMLEVARIDPAYAMHYADQASLKRDPDFNLKVASLQNNHGSGSALAEMLPEARTAEVVMAAIRSDYRNVRFVLPQMEGYDAMLARAKSGALEKVKALKESVGISLLIPKILQKDKEFMKQVEEIVPKPEQ